MIADDREWTPPKESVRVLKKDVDACMSEWGKTLNHFSIDCRPAAHDEMTIARGIQQFGPDWVSLAIVGARKEERTADYNPAKFVSLRSFLSGERIERLKNLGAGAQAREEGPRLRRLELPKWIETPAGFMREET